MRLRQGGCTLWFATEAERHRHLWHSFEVGELGYLGVVPDPGPVGFTYDPSKLREPEFGPVVLDRPFPVALCLGVPVDRFVVLPEGEPCPFCGGRDGEHR